MRRHKTPNAAVEKGRIDDHLSASAANGMRKKGRGDDRANVGGPLRIDVGAPSIARENGKPRVSSPRARVAGVVCIPGASCGSVQKVRAGHLW